MRGAPETWAPLPGFVKYFVSDLGRIRERETLKIIEPYRSPGGVMLVELRDHGNRPIVKKLARLVYMGFGYCPEGYSQILFKNGDRTDCRFVNLIHAGDPDKAPPRKKYGKEKKEQEEKASKRLRSKLPGVKERVPASESLYKALEEPEEVEVAPEPTPAPEVVTEAPVTIAKVSSQRGSKRINFKRPVYIVQTGEQFESVAALCRKYALDHSTVHKLLRGISRQRQHRGMTFAFVGEEEPKQIYNKSVDNALPSKNARRPVRIVGEKEVYDSQSDLARALDTHQSAISKVLRGAARHYKGMRFEYVEEDE